MSKLWRWTFCLQYFTNLLDHKTHVFILNTLVFLKPNFGNTGIIYCPPLIHRWLPYHFDSYIYRHFYIKNKDNLKFKNGLGHFRFFRLSYKCSNQSVNLCKNSWWYFDWYYNESVNQLRESKHLNNIESFDL